MTFALLAAVAAVPVEHHSEQYDTPAEYDFSYAVHDDHTGDIKSHQESRKGHAVTGKYELIDSDGYRRIVEYTADEHTGFNAIVHREPTDIKIPIHESHHSHQPAYNHYSQGSSSHSEHQFPVQHQYIAPKVVEKVVVKPIVKVSPIEIVEHLHDVPQVKYVAPAVTKVAKVAKLDHSNLNTHVSYNAPEFNYHY